MMKKIFLNIYLLAIPLLLNAQIDFNLFGEGNNESVKLLWTVKKWDINVDGVIVKRRLVNNSGTKTNWETLNISIIKIGNQKDKDLSNISNSNKKIKEVEKLRKTYLSNDEGQTQISEISEDALKSELEDENAIKVLGILFVFDYDIALMYGFGYADYKVPKTYAIEYGIFPVVSGNTEQDPSNIYQWIYGKEPDLTVKIKNQNIKKRKNNVYLKWEFDNKDLISKNNIAGFNIYKKTSNSKYEKLNEVAIWIDKASNKKILSYNDIIIDPDKNYTYAAAPVSIFKNEGKKYEISLNANQPEIVTPPELSTSTEANTNFINEGGIKLNWNFQEQFKNQISGFIVERKILPETEFKTISDTLSINDRAYIDNNIPLSDEKKYQYRVSALQTESFPVWSNVIRLFYDPKPGASGSVALNANPEIVNENVIVQLNWENDPKNNNLSQGYAIYCDRAGGILAHESEIPPIKSPDYNYIVEGQTGTEYIFAIGILDNDGIIYPYSDTISVVIPSVSLPGISIWPITVENQKVTINWKYNNEIIDLSGFRVYINENLVADENTINSTIRNWTSEDLAPGRYSFQIEAVTNYGITSKKSDSRIAKIVENE